MIRHMVLFNLGNMTESERAILLDEIKENLGSLPMVQSFQIGRAIDGASQYEYLLSMDLESKEALARYMEMHHNFAHDRFIPAMSQWMGKLNYRICEPDLKQP